MPQKEEANLTEIQLSSPNLYYEMKARFMRIDGLSLGIMTVELPPGEKWHTFRVI